MNPREWLTDAHLTEEGIKNRSRYMQFASYIEELATRPYQRAHALHLLQNISYDMLSDGYALPPHTINFCVNNTCNLRCSYCDLNHGRKSKGVFNTKVQHNLIDPKKKHELSLSVCKRILDEVAWFRPTIRVPWMEPLLYKNLFSLIDIVKSHDLNFSMLTNGLLLKKHADKLCGSGVNAIRVSLDGPSHIHDSLCGVRGAFSIVTSGLKHVAALRTKGLCNTVLGCYFTLNDKNCKYMLPMLEELDSLGLLEEMSVSFYMFNFISKDISAIHNEFHSSICGAKVEETSSKFVDLKSIDVAEVLQQKEIIEKRFKSRGVQIHYRPDFNEENMRLCLREDKAELPDARCDTFWHTAFVNPDGLMKPLPQCILPDFGNIHDAAFLDIWNGETVRRQRILLKEHKLFYGCSRCWSAYYSMEDNQQTWKDDLRVQPN